MTFKSKKLHLGCALNTPEGWLHLDGSWNAWVSKYSPIRNLLKYINIIPKKFANLPWDPNIFIHDVTKPLPFRDNSFSAIYASHLLEHLYLEEAKALLKECHRVLESQGILRIVVPDLKAIVFDYLEGNKTLNSKETVNRADKLNQRLQLRSPHRPSGNIIFRIYTAFKDFHSHKWVYDSISLINYFRWTGFIDVNEMRFHQSRIDRIEEIEKPCMNAEICVEGLKP